MNAESFAICFRSLSWGEGYIWTFPTGLSSTGKNCQLTGAKTFGLSNISSVQLAVQEGGDMAKSAAQQPNHHG